MNDEKNNRQTHHLEAPGQAFDEPQGCLSLSRYALTYWPQSTSSVNHERLPSVAETATMELAYREQLLSDGAVRLAARSQLLNLFFAVMTFSTFIAILSSAFSLKLLLQATGAFAAFAILYLAWQHRLTFTLMCKVLIAYPVVGLLAHFFGQLVAYRLRGVLAVGALTLFFFWRHGRVPMEFYYHWLFTHPRLRPETRRARPAVAMSPNYVLLLAVILLAAFGPFVSTTATIAVITILCALVCWREKFGIGLFRPAVDVLSQYVTYGTNASSAPGIWYPSYGPSDRRAILLRLVGSICMTLALGLSYFLPWEPLSLPLFEGLEKHVARYPDKTAHFQRLVPSFDPTMLPAPLGDKPEPPPPEQPVLDPSRLSPEEKARQETAAKDYLVGFEKDWQQKLVDHRQRQKEFMVPILRDHPHAWPIILYRTLAAFDSPAGWWLVLAAVLAVVTTIAVLTALYRKPLLAADALRRRIQGMHTTEPHGQHLAQAGSPRADNVMESDVARFTENAPATASKSSLTFEPERDHDDRTEWECYVDRVRTSQHTALDPSQNDVHEAEHLFLGVEPYLKFPILLDKKILAEHAYIVGESGSGKTALGIMPLLIQLIRGHADNRLNTREASSTAAGITPPPPMLILDLKGDPALFHTVRENVELRRKELGITDPKDPRFSFRFFTLEPKPTHFFNPFQSLKSDARSLVQVCHLILDSLNLSHGEGYGRSYYSRKNRMLLLEALHAHPEPRSFEELFQRIRERAARDRDVYRDCFELVATIHALTLYPQLSMFQPLKRPEDAIHMPSLIEHSQIAYFWLPALLESIAVREAGKLALYTLIAAAIDRRFNQGGDKQPRQIYLVIDEFQRIAGENFKAILEQARSFGVSIILSNQTQADLKTHDVDLRPTVRTNTRFKQFFAVSDPAELKELSELSGEEIGMLRSVETKHTFWQNYSLPTLSGESRVFHRRGLTPLETAQTGIGGRIQQFGVFGSSEVIKKRFIQNDLLRTSDHPLDSIVHISRGSGYTQFAGLPVLLRSAWPMHYSEYQRRQNQPWPDRAAYELDTTISERLPADNEKDRQRLAAEQAIDLAVEEDIRELISTKNPPK